LDFNLTVGKYVVASQEGDVSDVGAITGCGDDLGYGTFVEITDVEGFRHLYAHLNEKYWNFGQHVLPGWVLGKSGLTGHLEPCNQAGHLHYTIHNSAVCFGGNCIPEPLSDNCAGPDLGYPIYCGWQGPAYAFSHDPGTSGDDWKDNPHVSNNAGVGDYPVQDDQPLPPHDTAIIDRYLDEGSHHGVGNNKNVLVVGKPQGPGGASPYVHRWDSYLPIRGTLQDFDSPDPAYGPGAIMHGDTVTHDPADGRANISAMWVYGDFWSGLNGTCQGIQYFYYLGYPTTEEWELDYFGYHWWK
jgi:hypothetical protein